ncbi:MAG: hypothetical protein KAR07_12210 [Spirochaetes bacterium]|nr:hypothetical protein [Spirochaetota bacterium]
MKFGERYENIFAVGLILAFFLPWISFGGFFSLNGLDMPRILGGLGEIAKGFSDKKNVDTSGTWIFYIFYLIPILSISYLVLTLKKNKNIKVISIITGLIPILGLIYALINYGSKVIHLLSIGGYLTILCGIGMHLAAFGIIKPKIKQSEKSE